MGRDCTRRLSVPARRIAKLLINKDIDDRRRTLNLHDQLTGQHRPFRDLVKPTTSPTLRDRWSDSCGRDRSMEAVREQ